MKKLIFTCIYVFLFAVASGADCVETLSNIRLGDPTWGGFNYEDKTEEYTTSLNSPIVSFSYKTTSNSATGIQWRVDEYIDNDWKINVVSESKSGTSTIQLSKSTRKIRFVYSGNFAGDFSNIKITQGSYLELPTNDINFGVIEQGSSISNKSISINYSAINSDLTASIGSGVFSIDKTNIASAGCSYGTTTINVSFRPTQLGVFSDEIAFSNGSVVKVYGEYSRKINTTLKVVKEGYTSIRLSWDKVQDATAYRIVENTTGVTYTVDGAATEFNVTGLTMGTTYNFTLYAIFNGALSINGTNSVEATTKQVDVKLEDCVVFEDAEEKSYLVDISVERYVEYALPNDVSYYTKRLEFEVKASNNSYIDIDGDMGIYVLLRGADNYQKLSNWNGKSAGINENYKTCVVEIPYNTISIKFSNGIWNGSLMRYVRNLKVFKDNILESDINSIDFGEVDFGESVVREFNLTYANAAKLKAGIDSDQFSIVAFIDADACAEGVQTVSIKFSPNDCKADYTSSLSIFNGQDISITLTGSLKKPTTTVNKIIWNGTASTEWDNRDNWNKMDKSPLTCADILAEDLTVILPAGLNRYPTLPDISTEKAFKEDRNDKWNGTQVNAGDNATATKVADKIYMEYGAALVGVEGLNANGVSRYNEATVQFEARRKDWLLVGSILNPFEDGTTTPRVMLSGDFYLNNLPLVYMHEAMIVDNETSTWDESFSTLTMEIVPNKVFAIRLPNQYGSPNPRPAIPYNKKNGTEYDGEAPHTYTFRGRFYNESSLPVYENLVAGELTLLTNSYPANISAYNLQRNSAGELIGTVQYYSYEDKSFIPVGQSNIEIKAQHGFVFTIANSGTLKVDKSDFNTTEVNHRSLEEEILSMRLQATNESTNVSSEVYLRYDELKDDELNYAVDAPKVFNDKESSLPDLYIMRYNKKWSGLNCPTLSESLPLGIKVKDASNTFKLSLKESNLPFDVKLEDRMLGKIYNLAEEVCEISALEAGLCEGRYYLTFQEKEDEDITTDIADDANYSNKIDIFTQGRQVVVSAPAEANLQTIAVYDLSGRLQVYEEVEAGQYVKLDIPLSSGIYTIHALGTTAERVEKIRIN